MRMNITPERKYVIYMIFIAICAIYLMRLFYIQVIDDQYKLSASNNVIRYITQYPARGLVYDRNDSLLVYNEAVYDLMIIPKQVKNIDTNEFIQLIGITKEDFIKKYNKSKHFSRIKPSVFEKQLSARTYATLQEKLYKYAGFYVEERTIRKYSKKIAAHVFGYIGEVDANITKKNPYYKKGDHIGISGIERSYEKELRGSRGMRIVMVDVFNREKGQFEGGKYDTLAIRGENIISSLDAELQEYGEKLMQNKIGSVVAIEPATGEILSMISSPAYDPNLLVGRVRSKNYSTLLNDSLKPLFNRAMMAYYPPGSTFKLINGLIGQQEGLLFQETRYPCYKGYPPGNGKPACHPHPSPLNLQQSVQHSCNSYYCYVFKNIIDNKKYRLTEDAYKRWREYVLSFGIGKKLNVDLPHELKGFVPAVEYYDKYFGKQKWKSSTIISLSIGQGELGITPLQMANIMAIIANKGYYYVPHIIRSIGDKQKKQKKFITKNYTLVDSAYFNVIIQGMADVVQSGTAAGSKIKDIPFCGKTGTAQNPQGKDHSLFVGFAPKENPKIAIAVIVENAGFGATWAAPIASLMIEKYLTDSISRPEFEKRILDGNLISQ